MIQAKSLAAVVELADSPPERLQQDRLQHVQDPLVLYIIRVPGSRDVFLTTMKPGEKVVTAQDVQSSFYYLHVANDIEDSLRLSEEFDSNDTIEDERNAMFGADDLQRQSQTHGVYPKKAPASSTFVDRSHALPKIIPKFQPPPGLVPSTQVARKPIGSNGKPSRKTENAPPLPARKLLGPRSMRGGRHSSDSAALQGIPQRQNIDVGKWDRPALPPRPPTTPYDIKQHDLESIYAANSVPYVGSHISSHSNPSPSERGNASATGDHNAAPHTDELASIDSCLTLIRRYDGLQSNVGKIEIRTGPTKASPKSSRDVSLEMLSPGYEVFKHQNCQLVGIPDPPPTDSERSLDTNEEATAYRCWLHRPAKRPTHKERYESSTSSGPPKFGNRVDPRRHSEQISGDFDVAAMNYTAANEHYSSGFTFQSPWNGICEFSTGVAGRSLKCKHKYATGTNGTTRAVSELRFNLPSSKAFGSPAPKSPTPDIPREFKRSSFFANHRRQSSFQSRRNDPSGNWALTAEVEDRLDLSLGQEHAGGGFGGKQAKLGKLIVESEGLQMLDLVVAANMAMWWKVYDRLT